MNIVDINEFVKELVVLVGSLGTLIAGSKAVFDSLKARKSNPGDIRSQHREVAKHSNEFMKEEQGGDLTYRVKTSRLILRIALLVFMVFILFGLIGWYETEVGSLNEFVFVVMLLLIAAFSLISLIYIFRLVYRGLVTIILR